MIIDITKDSLSYGDTAGKNIYKTEWDALQILGIFYD